MIGPCTRSPRVRRLRGFSLLEVMVSMFMMSVLLVAVVNTLGAMARAQRVRLDQTRAILLGQDLMEEIIGLAYEEPYELVTFGPEDSETDGTRATFDDVDDYHQWNDGGTPPVSRDGSLLPGLSDWARTVTVDHVALDDVSGAAGGDEGVKRITVRVFKEGAVRRTLVMVRSASWRPPPYD